MPMYPEAVSKPEDNVQATGVRGRYGGGTPVEGGAGRPRSGLEAGGRLPPSHLNFSFGTASTDKTKL
jgi:hypothetical protein